MGFVAESWFPRGRERSFSVCPAPSSSLTMRVLQELPIFTWPCPLPIADWCRSDHLTQPGPIKVLLWGFQLIKANL